MNIIVQKYGGSSVVNIEKLEYVVEKVKKKIEQNNKVVVVVSAKGKTTEQLLNMAAEYGGKEKTKELDLLLSTGELQSASLLAMLLKKNNINAVAFSGGEAGIITDSNYGNAEILEIYPYKIKESLELGKVVVVAGFQGVDKYGSTTTLGRGGSDLTAVALAKALEATTCEIYSDIDGVYSADPNVVPKAKLLEKIREDEMLELATAGAKVMQNASVIDNVSSSAKLIVSNTCKNLRGTEIVKEKENYKDSIIKVTKKDKLSKVTLVGHGFVSRNGKVKEVVDILDKMKTNVYMIQITEISISLLVDEDKAVEVMNKLHDTLNK